jgi:ABC-type dipeptide/oligopeptide/nickel transport system permease subunit
MATPSTQAPELRDAGALVERQSGPWRDRLGAFLGQRSAQVGLTILGLLVACAILADVIAPYDPRDHLTGAGEPGRRAEPCIHMLGCPTDRSETWLGTDGNSRDVFSRTIHGTRISLWVGLVTVGVAILVGGSIGAVAGYVGGGSDNLLMRIMDVLLAFPALLLAIAIVTVLGQGLLNAQLAVAIVAIPIYARVMRSAVISVKERDFVTASRALGASPTATLVRRILPNSLTPVVVAGTLGIATAVLEVAALSFLGLGADPREPEWGNMIGREFNGIFTRPLTILAPGGALTLTVLAFNLIGDGLRDALDPRLNR